MSTARAERFYAENRDGSSWIDVVTVELVGGGFNLSYEEFEKLFGVKIEKGCEAAFKVTAELIPDDECEVPR